MSEEKLKTLKDFERKDYSEGEDEIGNKIKYFDERILKAEAIKWVKEDLNQINIDKFMSEPTKRMLLFLTSKWKERFNLTEEDLKDDSKSAVKTGERQ